MGNSFFRTDFSNSIFNNKYAHEGAETWGELSVTLIDSVCGKYLPKEDIDELKKLHTEMKFIAGGRYLYYAGRPNKYYNNCYIFLSEEDSREDWANLSWKAESALMTGGGIGNDYSIYRPKGSIISRTGGLASGAIAKMRMINEIGREVMQGGSRRSALFASLNWRHGDVTEFLKAKNWHDLMVPGIHISYAKAKEKDFNFNAPLDMTNISLNYDNSFLDSIYGDMSKVNYFSKMKETTIDLKNIPDTFLENCKQALKTGEPGFSFNFFDKEKETGRNACTEVTSADDSDVCNLGSLNMANIDTFEEWVETIKLGVKFLMCGTLEAMLPFDKVYKTREKNRRLGLGLMGVHEWLLKRGYRYEVTDELHKWLAAYKYYSDKVSKEFSEQLGISTPVANRAIAPTGTIGILAGTTTGIEPLYAVAYKRRYLKTGHDWHYQFVIDGTAKILIEKYDLDPHKIETAVDLAKDYERRIKFQADVNDYVDMSISSCLATGLSSIQTNKGLYEIEELAGLTEEKQFKDITRSLRSINKDGQLVPITQTFNNGIASTLKITMQGGWELTCTKEHKILCLAPDYTMVWKTAGSLTLTDYVVSRRGLNLFDDHASKKTLASFIGKPFEYRKLANSKMNITIPNYMSPDLARLLGYLCSDGWISVNGFGLSQLDNNVVPDFISLVKNLFNLDASVTMDKRSNNLCIVTVNSREVRDFFYYLGLGSHDTIKVPLVIRTATSGAVREFLKGMTLDGHVVNNGICVATSVSKKYLQQAQALLINLGMESRVSQASKEGERLFPSGNTYKTQQSWSLTLCASEASKFIDRVGFAEDRKTEESVSKFKRTSRKTSIGNIPDFGLRKQFSDSFLCNIQSNRLYSIFHSMTAKGIQGYSIARESVREMVDMGLQVPDYLLDDTYIFREITSISEFEKLQTYDLSVPDGNSYIANGVVVHNTLNMPACGSKYNNENTVNDFAVTLAKYSHRLRGFTCYPDGARGGQPLTSVDYYEAKKHEGLEFKEEFHDICSISGGGTCGV